MRYSVRNVRARGELCRGSITAGPTTAREHPGDQVPAISRQPPSIVPGPSGIVGQGEREQLRPAVLPLPGDVAGRSM